MKPYKKTYQCWYMASDIKPFGKEKRLISGITRAKIKNETKKEIHSWEVSYADQN